MGIKKVAKPKAIIMDMMGTAVKTGFIDKILMAYLKDNVKTYLEEKWSDKEVERDIRSLRKEAEKETSGPKIADAKADKAEQQKTVAEYVIHSVDNKKESKAMSRFRFHMWFDGYDKGKIQTRVYSDVAIQVKKWKDEQIKIYVLSNGWVEATKKFLSKTNHGDLSPMLDGHYDSKSEGSLTDKETYTKVVGKLGGVSAGDVLLLTKAADQAKAAKEAGLNILLVLTHRKNIEKLTDEEKQMPRVRSFNEIEFCTAEEAAAAAAAAPPPAAEGAAPAAGAAPAEGAPAAEGAAPTDAAAAAPAPAEGAPQ